MIKKIISGGQTGADQAALDVAIKLGIPHGGWIPKICRRKRKLWIPFSVLLGISNSKNATVRTAFRYRV